MKDKIIMRKLPVNNPLALREGYVLVSVCLSELLLPFVHEARESRQRAVPILLKFKGAGTLMFN